jgi:hypothetical protein
MNSNSISLSALTCYSTFFLQDIVSFTNLCDKCSPEDVMNMLHSLFSRFDALSAQYGVFKVETIGKLENKNAVQQEQPSLKSNSHGVPV